MYKYDIKKAAWRTTTASPAIKSDYERGGRDPSNLRTLGFVVPG